METHYIQKDICMQISLTRDSTSSTNINISHHFAFHSNNYFSLMFLIIYQNYFLRIWMDLNESMNQSLSFECWIKGYEIPQVSWSGNEEWINKKNPEPCYHKYKLQVALNVPFLLFYLKTNTFWEFRKDSNHKNLLNKNSFYSHTGQHTEICWYDLTFCCVFLNLSGHS